MENTNEPFKANFKYNADKAVGLCLEYSDDKETLRKLIDRLSISINLVQILERSPWNEGYKAVLYSVEIEGLRFDYYGSHADAEALQREYSWSDARNGKKTLTRRQIQAKKQDVRNGMLYSVLCSIRCDYWLIDEEPEDLGYNRDSIKDMANWNKAIEHCKQLRHYLKLSEKELNSLPC